MGKLNVVVSGAGALLGQGVMRSLKHSSLRYKLIALDPSPNSAGLYWADEAYLIPMAKSPNFVEKLIARLSNVKADVFIPGTDVELPVLAEARSLIEKETGCKVIVSSPKVVEAADDKYLTARFFADRGFAFPRSARQDNPQEISALIEELGFPLLVKPRIGARSIGVVMIENAKELEDVLSKSVDNIVQEYLDERRGEYTASGLYFNGKCEHAIVMRRDLRDGNTYRAFVVKDEALDQQVKDWSIALEPCGPANFQFRYNKNGQPTVFEINARFSGTTPLRALVGFNEVQMAIEQIALGKEIAPYTIEEKSILRHWSETVVENETIEKLAQSV